MRACRATLLSSGQDQLQDYELRGSTAVGRRITYSMAARRNLTVGDSKNGRAPTYWT